MDLSRNLFLFLAFYQCLVTSHSVNADDKVSPYQYFLNCLHLKEDWERFHGQHSSHPLAEPRRENEAAIPCRNYTCLMNNDKLDLEKLKHFTCQHDSQCAQNVSGMICSNHSYKSYNSSNDNVKFCSCPYGEAYSTVECRCKPAQLCNSSEHCHKGMKCQDHRCSCQNLEELLYEIHGGFCIESRKRENHPPQQADGRTEVIVVALLAAFVTLGLIAIGLYFLSVKRKDIDFCARGAYVCDNNKITAGNRQNQPHVAAWDAPGMDFLSEEQTLKYLNRSNSIEVTKSPSMATTAELVDEAPSPSGSLPECEQGGRLTMIRVHQAELTNFENPTYSSSRHSSESTKDDSDDTEIVTKSSNIL